MVNSLKNLDLYYPSAIDWMWNYCIYLGGFTSSKGVNYDMGVHIDEDGEISAAVVTGNNPGDYRSGDISNSMYRKNDEVYIELIKRLQALNLM